MANNYTTTSLEALKFLCSVINKTVELPSTVISDTSTATNTTYSSFKLDKEFDTLEDELKHYTDTAIAGLNKLTKEIINDKSLVVKDNVLYLYKADDDASNDYMQMMLINGVAVELGSTQVDMSNYYSKTDSDNKFAAKLELDTLTTSVNDKIDKTSILTAKDSSATDDQVYSAKTINTELDDVVKKTDISTTIDSTSTDNTVPTNKAVYNSLANKLDKPVVADVPWTQLTMGSGMSGTIYYRIKNGICYVCVTALKSSTMSTANQTITSNLPTPEITNRIWYSIAANDPTLGTLLVNINSTGKMINHIGVDNASYYGTFLYPVAES